MLQQHPFLGKYNIDNSVTSGEPMDIYEVVALAKRLNITLDDMKEMTFVSLINILLTTVKENNTSATQTDIDRFF